MTHPRAIKTNGERQVCTSHLNTSVTLADVWGVPAEIAQAIEPRDVAPKAIRKPKLKRETKPKPFRKLRFAGYDPYERNVGSAS